MKRFLSMMACFAVTCFCAHTAFAAVESYVVEIQSPVQELIGYLMAAVGGLVVGIVGWLLDPNTGKLAKLKIDAETRAYLETAIQAGLNYAENSLRSAAKDIKNPTVQNEMLSIAVNYILPRVPDALEHFGIDPTDLRAMILARFKLKDEASHVVVS